MIGKLRGIIDSISDDSVIVDVGGVGYLVYCSGQTLRKLPPRGAEASFIIETHVREDHIKLYGFMDRLEQEWFLELNNVQGVGTKMALGILSALTPQQLIAALVSQDKAAFKQISGVGPKLSERLVVELKSKVKGMSFDTVAPLSGQDNAVANNGMGDAISALVNLGYNRSDAYTVIAKIANKNENMQVSELIREGLKQLGK